MNRYTPRHSDEFETRQMCFEFGKRARRIASEVAATIAKAGRHLAKHFRLALPAIKFHQLVLELDGIAQIPLFNLSA